MWELIAVAVVGGALVGLAVHYAPRPYRRRVEMTIPTFTGVALTASQQAQLRRVDTVVANATTLLHRVYSGASISRAKMSVYGIKERPWKNAVSLLRQLGVFAADGTIPLIPQYRAEKELSKWKNQQYQNIHRAPRFVTAR